MRNHLIRPLWATPVSLVGKDVVVTTRGDTDVAVAAMRAAIEPQLRRNIEGHALDLCDRKSVQKFAE
jgi:hypothetical protein